MSLRGAAAPLGLPAIYGSGKYKNAKKVLENGNSHLDIFGLSRAIETFRKYFYREQWLGAPDTVSYTHLTLPTSDLV